MNIKYSSEYVLAIVLGLIMFINGSANGAQYFETPQAITYTLTSIAWLMVVSEIVVFLFFSKKESYDFKSKFISFKITNQALKCKQDARDLVTLKFFTLLFALEIGFMLGWYALSVVVSIWTMYNIVQLFKIRKQFAY